jgi:uncharacterized protein
MPTLTRLPPEGFRRTPWKNGGGVNADIADDGASEGWSRFNWRFGRTAIVQPGPFSDFTGYERLQVVISGTGLVLVTPEGEIDLRVPFRPVRYDGALPIVTRLEAGAVEVVNLVADKGRFAIDMAVLGERIPDEAIPGETISPRNCLPGVHIAYVPFGAAELRVDADVVVLGAGHGLRLDAGTAFSLAATGGPVILASIAARVA